MTDHCEYFFPIGGYATRRRLRKHAVPSRFAWSDSATVSQLERDARLQQRNSHKLEADAESVPTVCQCSDLVNEVVIDSETCDADDCVTLEVEHPFEKQNCSVSSQTIYPCAPFSIEHFIFDNEGIQFYTGLDSYSDFLFVLATLGPGAYHLNYKFTKSVNLSVENQFFVTLMKLRQHKQHFELSRMFGISEFMVSNIYLTWVNFMARQWREVNVWPSKDAVKFFAPSDFKMKFPSTRIIIDGTECPIKKPKTPVAQQSSFSTYKNRNTLKVLAGMTPGGLVSYVSPAYGGSTSDRQIVERSALIRLCDPFDSIMADKGFNVQDLFAVSNVKINIPTFFRKKNRMSGKIVMKDRKISSKRCHIERMIGLAKTYKVLREPMTVHEIQLGSEIIFICFMLCNFRNCIMSPYS
jgi:hypothetical protein